MSNKLPIKLLSYLDPNGKESYFFPKTSTDAVIDDTNVNLTDILIDKINKNELSTINGIELINGKNLVIKDIYVGQLDKNNGRFICSNGNIAINAPNKLYIDVSNHETKLYIWNNEFILIFKNSETITEKFEGDNKTPGSVRNIAKEEAESIMSWEE